MTIHDRAHVLSRAVVLIAIAFGAGACNESHFYVYRDMTQARKAGAVARGWVPDYIPSSAFDIKVFYRVDVPEAWLTAGCSGECAVWVRNHTEPYEGDLPPAPRTSWLSWPQREPNSGPVEFRRYRSGGLLYLDASDKHLYVFHKGEHMQ